MAIEGTGRKASVSREDAELLHAWARLKAIGISPERGFMPRDLEIIEEAISRLVRREIEVLYGTLRIGGSRRGGAGCHRGRANCQSDHQHRPLEKDLELLGGFLGEKCRIHAAAFG